MSTTKRILAAGLALTMLLGMVGTGAYAAEPEVAAPSLPAGIEVGQTYTPTETGRQQINFNREWKFMTQKVTDNNAPDFGGATAAAFDDSAWTDVGLPHSFSIPYNMESTFFVGYGMYRKTFDVPQAWMTEGKRVSIEFEGSFIETEVFVNGAAAGTHLGGYTGFTFDITEHIKAGENVIAVRVNNKWRPDATPRIGDHQFTGGIYRDVYLNVTDSVHVTWYGTAVSTPALNNPGFDERDSAGELIWDKYENIDISSYTPAETIRANIAAKRSDVAVSTEVRNDFAQNKTVIVRHEVVDRATNTVVAAVDSAATLIPAGQMVDVPARSEMIQNIKLWSPESPDLYTVYTTVYDAESSTAVDSFTSPLGFRWAQFLNDGFYLNGVKTFLFGANVHQDRAGWGDAGTNEAFSRDVAMVKESGMNFIRGSHYPHDPSFSAACDEQGMLFWSESVFWGMGGYDAAPDDSKILTYTSQDWNASGYPDNEADFEAFDQSCLDTLEEMVRVNRNHPSIVVWSMGNEMFMEKEAQIPRCKALVNRMRNLTHQLDPTRKAGMGGTQRWNFDTLEVCDVAGYNGDGGGFEFNGVGQSGTGMGQRGMTMMMPSIAAEYGSHTSDRGTDADQYVQHFNEISDKKGSFTVPDYRAGISLWCAFHHGSVGGGGLARMGFIDYSRLPLKTWYWYRNEYTEVAPEFSKEGTATQMTLTASQATVPNDGTADAHLVVTMCDAQGDWVNDSPTVTLEVTDGPGVFPTGKRFVLRSGNTMRDGKGAIDFHSYYSGTTTIEASAPGLDPVTIQIVTEDITGDESGPEPENFMVEEKTDTTDKLPDAGTYGGGNFIYTRPTSASSGSGALATDGDPATVWAAENKGPEEFWRVFTEADALIYKVKVDFPNNILLPYTIETATSAEGPWTARVTHTADSVLTRPYEDDLGGVFASYVKISFPQITTDQTATLADVAIYAVQASTGPTDGATEATYTTDTVYVSDLTPTKPIVNGYGTVGMDCSNEGTPITLDGVVYKKGLGLHASSEAVYALDGKYTRFQAVAGIDDETNGGGDAIFRVYAIVTVDGEDAEKLIYEQQVTPGNAQKIDLSVRGVKTLRLVTDKNGSDSADHTDWADAKLLGAVRNLSKTGLGVTIGLASSTQGLKAGEDFSAYMTLQNTGAKVYFRASLALYDQDGTLRDVVLSDSTGISKGQSEQMSITLAIPGTLQAGWEARLNVFDANGLTLLAKTTHFGVETAGVAAAQIEDAPVPLAAQAELLAQIEETETEAQPQAAETWVEVFAKDTPSGDKQGAWGEYATDSAHSGVEYFIGDGEYQLVEGDFIQFAFTGNKAQIYGKRDGSMVNAEVYVDGATEHTLTNSIETTTANQGYFLVWESETLTHGEHTIKLVPKGKIGLDYFRYQSANVDPAPEAVWEKVDFTVADPEGMTRQGAWENWSDSSAHGGTQLFIGDPGNAVAEGDHISYQFRGTQLKIVGDRGPGQNNANMFVDGAAAGTTDSRTGSGYGVVWTSAVLPYGIHTVKLVPTAKISLDYLEYQSVNINDDPVVEWVKTDGEDSSGAVEKSGNWGNWTGAGTETAFQHTETFIGDTGNELGQNDFISMTFTGIQVSVGAKADGKASVGEVWLDGNKVGAIDCREPIQDKQGYFVVWTSAVLENKQHTLKIVPTGKFGLDYFDTLAEGGTTRLPSTDKSALKAQIDIATNKVADAYLAEGWAAMQLKLTAAQAVWKKADATQTAIDTATQELTAAIAALVDYDRPDLTSLVTAMGKVLALIESDTAGAYAVAPVAEAFGAGYALYSEAQPDGQAVTAAAAAIEDALANLVEKPVVAVTDVTLNKTTAALTTKGSDTTVQLTATVAPTDATNKEVTWSSGAPGVATVSQTGLVTAVNNGTAVITVTTVDGGKTATCTVTVSAKHAVTVDSGITGGMVAVSAAPAAPGDTVTITVTPASGKQLVAGSLKVYKTGDETDTVPVTPEKTFTMPDYAVTVTAQFEAAPVTTYTVTVTKGTVTTPSTGGSFAAGTEITVTAAAPEAGQRFTHWTCGTANVNVTGANSAVFTFTMPAGAVALTANYEPIPTLADLAVTLVPADGKVTVTAMTPEGGAQFYYKSTPAADGANKPLYGAAVDTVTWTAFTADTDIVGANGTALFVQVVKATAAGIVAWGEASATPVSPPVGTHYLSVVGGSGSGYYTAGAEVAVAAIVPQGKRFVRWEATGATLADATKPSFTLTMPAGAVTLTAVFEDDTVPVTGVALDHSAYTLYSNTAKTVQLAATVAPTDATNKNVTWASDKPEVATVSQTGLVTAVSNGTAVITVTTVDGGKTATCLITVTTYTDSSGGGSSGSSSNTTTEKNEDGSTTKIVTNKTTGTVTETTTHPDGTVAVVETKKDGTVTQKVTAADGSTAQSVKKPDGSMTAREARKDGTKLESKTTAEGKTTATVTVPKTVEKVTVTVPTPEKPKPGEVAVIVKEDGTREVIKTSVATEGGMKVTLPQGATLEIVDNSKAFADVSADAWYGDAVAFASSREIFQGTGEDFAPSQTMTRGMLITVLYRFEGASVQSDGDAWYSDALAWSKTTGLSDGTAPDAGVSREQMAVFLYRYSGSPKAEGEGIVYADSDSISPWAADAMRWATEEGLLQGAGGKLNPNSAASRAEVATILQRFITGLSG